MKWDRERASPKGLARGGNMTEHRWGKTLRVWGRNSSKNLEAETTEEAAYWLVHRLMFSWLSNTA